MAGFSILGHWPMANQLLGKKLGFGKSQQVSEVPFLCGVFLDEGGGSRMLFRVL